MKYDGLKAMRTRQQVSVEQISKRCGVTAATVYAWQSGVRRPSDKHLWTLARLLKADAAKLRGMFDAAHAARGEVTK